MTQLPASWCDCNPHHRLDRAIIVRAAIRRLLVPRD
jgi:hypothetical protein